MVFYCPQYEKIRADFVKEASPKYVHLMSEAWPDHSKLSKLLASHLPEDWVAFGKFLARVRQARRLTRRRMAAFAQRSVTHNYVVRKAAWKLQGRRACSHGIFFKKQQGTTCPCMRPQSSSNAWRLTKFTPYLDNETKTMAIKNSICQAIGV